MRPSRFNITREKVIIMSNKIINLLSRIYFTSIYPLYAIVMENIKRNSNFHKIGIGDF